MKDEINIYSSKRSHRKTSDLSNNEKAEPKKILYGNEGVTGFIDSLLQKKIISLDQIEVAIEKKKKNNGTEKRLLLQIIIEECGLDRELIYSEFARYYALRILDLKVEELNKEQLGFINSILENLPGKLRDAALSNKILPYQVSEKDPSKLLIITPDPSNTEIARIARVFPYPKFEICYVSLAGYMSLIDVLTAEGKRRPMESGTQLIEEDGEQNIVDLEEEIAKGHIHDLVDNIFSDAVRVDASDIHFIPRSARKTEIHFRIDGDLNVWQTIDDIRSDAVAAVVKDISRGVDRFERNMAQDGFIQKTIENKIIRFRVSIIPLLGKDLKLKLESIVLRVLRDPEESITIDNIGFSPRALSLFRRAIEKPHGLIILTGPTGSGKSTTLLAALRAVMSPAYNILTVEDPVEYLIDGVRQVKLNPKLGFEEALRAILRHDPDIVMVGEIRDKQTADFAIKLANTGHLTFSTLHTNDATSVIARLYKMGIEPFLLSYSINVIVAQRLLRRLCERCKAVDHDISPASLERIGISRSEIEGISIYRPVGCIHCLKGYRGRASIHELLYFTKEIRQLISESGESINEELLRQLAVKQGMQNLRDSGIELIKKGITTIDEIVATTVDD